MFVLAAFLLLFGTLLVGCVIGLLASLPRILRLEKQRDNFKQMAQKWADEAAKQHEQHEMYRGHIAHIEAVPGRWLDEQHKFGPIKADPLDADLIGDE